MIRILLAVVLLLAGVAGAKDLTFDEHMAAARKAGRARQWEEAIGHLKKAVKLDPKQALPYLALCEGYEQVGAYADCVKAADKAFELATDDETRAQARRLKAKSLIALGDMADRDRKKYEQAELAYREAIKLSPQMTTLYAGLGRTLLKLNRDAEGIAELKRYMELNPDDRSGTASAARQYIENPRRARENFMPTFAVTTLDGERITTDELTGKIVLLDFWATWCPPCRETVPELRTLAKRYAGKPLVILSISADTDREKWRAFVAEEKMEWPQYFDGEREVIDLFGVRSYPTFVVVDDEGVMQKVEVGAGTFTMGMIEDRIKKILKKMEKSAKPAA